MNYPNLSTRMNPYPTPPLPPVLPGFSEPRFGSLKVLARNEQEFNDVAGGEKGQNKWTVGYYGTQPIWHSLRLGSPIALANGIGVVPPLKKVDQKIYKTGKVTWLFNEPRDYTENRAVMNWLQGPCPRCGSVTITYGSAFSCCNDLCENSASRFATRPVDKAPDWWGTEVDVFLDGNAWFAIREGFINLQESPAGFGATPDDAVKDMMKEPLPVAHSEPESPKDEEIRFADMTELVKENEPTPPKPTLSANLEVEIIRGNINEYWAERFTKLESDLAAARAEIKGRTDDDTLMDTFRAWAQSYLDSGRWAGFRLYDAVMTELIERDREVQRLRAALEWTPISNSLPKIGEEVLGTCLIDGDWIFPVIGTYRGRKTEGHAIVLEVSDDDFHPCDHWRAIPLPPEVSPASSGKGEG